MARGRAVRQELSARKGLTQAGVDGAVFLTEAHAPPRPANAERATRRGPAKPDDLYDAHDVRPHFRLIPTPAEMAKLESKQRARLRNMVMGGGAASAQEDRARQASGSPSKSAKRLDIKPTQKLI